MPKVYQFFIFIFLLTQACVPTEESAEVKQRPNVLLIVADDLGYTDIGAFGGDISTPNLDELAANGLTFSRFHTAPMCAVTRAMLLSGTDNHIAGMGSQDLQTEEFGYEGHLTDRIVPMPELFKEKGYHTFITGKWHLGNKKEENPHYKGFEKSFVLIEGAANHYSDRGIFKEDSVSPYTENGINADWPKGAYSTDFYTDKLISYIDKFKEDKSPFFAYAAYTSPHWPLQVDEKYWKNYSGLYNDGYEHLRIKRFESLKSKGLIPENAVLPKLHPSVEPWTDLSHEEKKKEIRKMELYAGMVENLDANIGRLISHLKNTGQYENTVIIFLSDNGAAANDFYHHKKYGTFIRNHFTNSYEEMGTEKSFIAYGPQWAEAGAAPFKYFKGYTSEGGICAPLIILGAQKGAIGKVSSSFTTVMDLAPTLYELCRIEYPNVHNGKNIYPLKGNSLADLFLNPEKSVHDDDYVFALEHRGQILIRKGNWKLVNNKTPFSPDNFELYDISIDLAEQVDRRNDYPEVYQELNNEWEKYREEVKVQIPTPKQ